MTPELVAHADALLRSNGGAREADSLQAFFARSRTTADTTRIVNAARQASAHALSAAESAETEINALNLGSLVDPICGAALQLLTAGWHDGVELWRNLDASVEADYQALTHELDAGEPSGRADEATALAAHHFGLKASLVARLIKSDSDFTLRNIEQQQAECPTGFQASLAVLHEAVSSTGDAAAEGLHFLVQEVTDLIGKIVKSVASALPWWTWIVGGLVLTGIGVLAVRFVRRHGWERTYTAIRQRRLPPAQESA